MCKFVNVTVIYLGRHRNNCVPSEAEINCTMLTLTKCDNVLTHPVKKKISAFFFYRVWFWLNNLNTFVIWNEIIKKISEHLTGTFMFSISIDFVFWTEKEITHCTCVCVFIRLVYEKCEKYRRVMSCHVVSHQDNSCFFLFEFILKYLRTGHMETHSACESVW